MDNWQLMIVEIIDLINLGFRCVVCVVYVCERSAVLEAHSHEQRLVLRRGACGFVLAGSSLQLEPNVLYG